MDTVKRIVTTLDSVIVYNSNIRITSKIVDSLAKNRNPWFKGVCRLLIRFHYAKLKSP